MILMVSGIALFGVFTGLFARLLIASEDDSVANETILAEIYKLREEIQRLQSGTITEQPKHASPEKKSEDLL
jgi:hypothetical protein